MTDPDASGCLAWERVRDHVLSLAGAAGREADARLPTERELQRQLGVSRQTVRRAMAELARDGLVRIEQGRGTFLHAHALTYALGERPRFTEVVLRQNLSPGREVLERWRGPAASDVVEALALPEGAQTIAILVRSSASGRPISLGTLHFDAVRFPGIDDAIVRSRSVTAALRLYGVEDHRRARTRIRARLPTGREAGLLRQLPHQPVFEVWRVDVDMAGHPVSHSVSAWSAGRVEFSLDH